MAHRGIKRWGIATRFLCGLILLVCLIPALQADSAMRIHFDRIGGTTETLQQYRGEIVVLNFWATWCSPCIIEIPHLVELQDQILSQGATVIGLSIDSGTPEAIQRFWTRRLEIEPNYPLWLGTAAEATELFDVKTYPQTLIIDRKGTIRQRLLGLQTREELMEAIRPLL